MMASTSESAAAGHPATEKATPLVVSEPNATLYISNLDWKIKKPVLRRSLHSLFSRHGKILEVVTLRREGLRGQAWVIFEDVSSATAALQAEQNFPFFGKDLKIAYANEKSDRVAKRDGTFVPKDRRAKREAQAAAKRARLAREASGSSVGGGAGPESTSTDRPAPAPPAEAAAVPPELSAPPSAPPPPPPATAAPLPPPPPPAEENVPSPILFAQDLPAECNEMMLAMLFRQYAGYKEVRIPRPGLAFVEFDDEPHATLALRGLNGFKLTTADTLNLKYGKA